MSSRDTVSVLAAGTAFSALLVLFLYGHLAHAEEAVPTPPSSSAGLCMKADLEGVPPPSGTDCTEYQVGLEQQARRMESQAKIMEQQAKRLEILAKIQEAKEQITGEYSRKANSNKPANDAPSPPIQLQQIYEDRVLEVFGEQARIRYRGGEILVRQGQALSQGGLVGHVSLDGVVLFEGGNKHVLPFYIGEVGRK